MIKQYYPLKFMHLLEQLDLEEPVFTSIVVPFYFCVPAIPMMSHYY